MSEPLPTFTVDQIGEHLKIAGLIQHGFTPQNILDFAGEEYPDGFIATWNIGPKRHELKQP